MLESGGNLDILDVETNYKLHLIKVEALINKYLCIITAIVE